MKRLQMVATIAVGLSWCACSGTSDFDVRRQALDSDPLLERLRSLPGVTVEEVTSQPGTRGFLLSIEQPADHAHPERATFHQRAVLLHRGVDQPVILATAGYELFGLDPYDSEVSAMLQANSLYLEHRFFGDSIPDPVDYRLLTIRQAAEDDHRVVTLLKEIYRAKWLTTGQSKGGMTSVYHRRFFPDDVDGTIAYVAPQSYGTNDPRYPPFLERLGSAECRRRIVDFQRAILSKRSELLPLYQTQADTFGVTYERAGGLDVALEHAAEEFGFVLWMFHGEASCQKLPSPDAPADVLMSALDSVQGPVFAASDQSLVLLDPYWYQAATQLGAPGPAERHLRDLLRYPGTDRVESYSPVPVDSFDVLAMPEVQAWLALFGERVMLIYGENDPYSAAAFALGYARDSFRYFVKGANHLTADLAALPEPQHTEAVAALERWAGTRVSQQNLLELDSAIGKWRAERNPRRLLDH